MCGIAPSLLLPCGPNGGYQSPKHVAGAGALRSFYCAPLRLYRRTALGGASGPVFEKFCRGGKVHLPMLSKAFASCVHTGVTLRKISESRVPQLCHRVAGLTTFVLRSQSLNVFAQVVEQLDHFAFPNACPAVSRASQSKVWIFVSGKVVKSALRNLKPDLRRVHFCGSSASS